jgi:DNA-binding XRE family transcriptional regulator
MVYLVMDGEQVRELRQKKRMSQRQLAAEANVSKKTISDVEAGKVRPQVSTVRKIAAALQVDPRSLALPHPQPPLLCMSVQACGCVDRSPKRRPVPIGAGLCGLLSLGIETIRQARASRMRQSASEVALYTPEILSNRCVS